MRIIYDDCAQGSAVMALYEFVLNLRLEKNIDKYVRYEWGMKRIQMDKIKTALNKWLFDYNLQIGNTVTHANGIGNNCKYPIYFYAGTEVQHCADININTGMYGDGYISIEDYNGKKVGNTYEFYASRIIIK